MPGDLSASRGDIDALLRHIDTTITRQPTNWASWPGGWRDEISTALIDAVFSARATYETKHGRGIKPQVLRWRSKHAEQTRSLRALTRAISATGPETWAKAFGNSQVAPRRPDDAPGGATKAATVLEAALALIALTPPVDSAQDVTDDAAPTVIRTLLAVKGIGDATSNYFLMLLGRPGVKPDRMVHRYLRDALHRDCSNREAMSLIASAATDLGVAAHELDHAIWGCESAKAAERRSGTAT